LIACTLEAFIPIWAAQSGRAIPQERFPPRRRAACRSRREGLPELRNQSWQRPLV